MIRTRAYNIIVEVGDRLIAGTTDTDFSIEPEFDEVVVKDSAGEPDLDHSGNSPCKINISGLFILADGVDEDDTHIDAEELREIVDTGDEHVFVYGSKAASGNVVTGDLRFLDYSEKSGPTGYAEWSVSAMCSEFTNTTRNLLP